jgi:hypothetical protein
LTNNIHPEIGLKETNQETSIIGKSMEEPWFPVKISRQTKAFIIIYKTALANRLS